MSVSETVAALMLTGALALSLPCPLYASDAPSSPPTEYAPAAQAKTGRISLVRGDDGAVLARSASPLEHKKLDLTWKIDVSGTQGPSRTVELRIKNVQAGELDSDSEIELVSPGPRPGLLRVGSVSKSAPEAQTAYVLSMRLSGSQDATPDDAPASVPVLLSIGEQAEHGRLELKRTGAENLALTRKEPSERLLNEALAAPKDNGIAQVHEITSAWTDFTWSGSGGTEISFMVPPGNTSGVTGASTSTPIQDSCEDASSPSDGKGDSDSPKASTTDASPKTDAAQDGISNPEGTLVSTDAQSRLAQAMGAATDIDPDNFTAAVALDSPRSLEASAPAAYATDEPVRQRIILSVPKTFELLFLPSGEVVAPTALTVLGGERAYNDIKDMTLTDKATQATLELYAPEDDGSLSQEYDGTTFLKGYRRLDLKEDVSYTVKLEGLDHEREQDLIMAAIEAPQHLFTLNVVFMPIIP